MPVIEFEGKTTEEAIEKACEHLHIPKDELKFEIVTTGSSGIFGLGGKKARVRVAIQERISAKPALAPAVERTERAEERRERDEDAEREARPHPERQRPPRPRRPRPEIRPAPPAPASEHEDDEEDEAPVGGATLLAPTTPGPGEEVYDGPEDEEMAAARKALADILELMGVPAEVEVRRISERLILNVGGEAGGLLIGKKGTTLDALQFLLNKMINRGRTEKRRVIVDTQNYRERRHQALIELAQRMAAKARRNRRPVTISQLSAHDRRVVHLVLQETPGLRTRSRGDGPVKNVIIIPAGSKGRRPGGDEERPRYGEDHDVHRPPAASESAGEAGADLD